MFQKVTKSPYVCQVLLSFDGSVQPKVFDTVPQAFYDSVNNVEKWQKAYATKSSIRFSENSNDSKAGFVYNQSIRFSFPSNDNKRSERIAAFQKVKFVTLKLTDGRGLLLGRNDIDSNNYMFMRCSSNERTTQIVLSTKSIFPAGFNNILSTDAPTDQNMVCIPEQDLEPVYDVFGSYLFHAVDLK